MTKIKKLFALCFILSASLFASYSQSASQGTIHESFNRLKEQLLSLQTQIDNYKTISQSLSEQVESLKKDSLTDRQLSIDLTQELETCQQDLVKAQTLYKQLSLDFQNLKISLDAKEFMLKTVKPIIIITSIIAVGEFIYIITK